jgi:integrase
MTRLERKDVIAAQKANLSRAKFANDIPAIMSVLCEHAIDIGWIQANPAKGVRKIPIPESRKRPHVPWTDEAVAKWRAEAKGRARLVFELGIGSVQRPADWVAFYWGDFDGENLRLTQNKTNKSLVLPCSEPLKAALREELKRLGVHPHPNRPILLNAHGERLSQSGMMQLMRKERKRLGLSIHDQHALRYRGVMELAWAGCDDDEIMSYSGHETKQMVIIYAGLARQIMRANSAAEKRRLWSNL